MKQNERLSLPIDPYTGEILGLVEKHSTLIVKASPGSGKTTRLPWAISQGLNKKVVVLEPRKLAAKLAAMRIADEQNLSLGEEVGYHFRFEKKCHEKTPLIFYTEGTFLKKFLQDPEIKDVDVVILDEFHERHLETDLALALLRDLQTRRPIKIILMSATLSVELTKAFPDSGSIEIEAKLYPVEVSYLPNQPSILNQSLESKVKKAVEQNPEGDILVFLPGMREMLRVKDVLPNHHVFLLHADLSKEEQQEALGPSSRQKIILATNIAESSVTIAGIKTVIDSGIQREAHYSAWNGLKFILDVPTTKSSAIQRAGRAGRTSSGRCIRLYSEQDFNQREEHTIPEIEKADLTDIRLLVAGTKLSPHWFHSPPKEKWQKAQELLVSMGAMDCDEITQTGKKMLEYPLDARLSRILVASEKLRPKLKEKLIHYICHEIEDDHTGSLKKRLHSYIKTEGADETPLEKNILYGFLDQVARFRSKQRDFIHYSGKTIKAHPSQTDLTEGFYLILDITQRQEAIKILPIDESWLWELDPFPFQEEDEIQIDEKISIRRKIKYGSLVMEEAFIKCEWATLPQETKRKISLMTTTPLKNKIKEFKESSHFERIHYWAKMQNLNADAVVDELKPEEYFDYARDLSWKDLDYFLSEKIETVLRCQDIDRLLPLKINLGGKRELEIHYPVGMDPYIEAPIQDFYGLNDTPSIYNNQIALTLKLIGPHKRPMQITKDLKNFWNKTYQEMKKEYQREYPRHYWPEKPWEAKPILLKRMLPPGT